MASELIGTDDLIRDLLAADSALTTALGGTKIYADQAPQGTLYPYVILAFLSAPDTMVSGGFRAYTQPLYLVKAVTETNSWALAGTIVDRIDTVLHRAAGTRAAQGIEIQSVTREQIIRYIETPPQGSPIRHYGGNYRLFVSYQ